MSVPPPSTAADPTIQGVDEADQGVAADSMAGRVWAAGSVSAPIRRAGRACWWEMGVTLMCVVVMRCLLGFVGVVMTDVAGAV